MIWAMFNCGQETAAVNSVLIVRCTYILEPGHVFFDPVQIRMNTQ